MPLRARPFSNEDREMLKILVGDGYLTGEIAEKMDRTPGVISKYMAIMGLQKNTQAMRRLKRLNSLKQKVEVAQRKMPPPPINHDALLERLQAGRR